MLRLQLTDNPDLLNSISKAYDCVIELNFIGNLFFSPDELARQQVSLYSNFFAGFKAGALSKASEDFPKAVESINQFLKEEK